MSVELFYFFFLAILYSGRSPRDYALTNAIVVSVVVVVAFFRLTFLRMSNLDYSIDEIKTTFSLYFLRRHAIDRYCFSFLFDLFLFLLSNKKRRAWDGLRELQPRRRVI